MSDVIMMCASPRSLVKFPGDGNRNICRIRLNCTIYRGYYTVARRYEFYVRVARTILFLPREHKIHIFEPTCNVLFIIWRLNIQQKQKAGIVTSFNDTTPAKVTYEKYATRVPDEVAYGIYEWFRSQ